MALTRAQLLKRALIGGVALSFPTLPKQLLQSGPAELPAAAPEAFSVVRITNIRTAIPSAARLANVQHVEVRDVPRDPRMISLSEEIALLEPNRSPLLDLMRRDAAGQLGTYTAQRVEWLEDELMPRYSDVLYEGEIGELTVSEPSCARYFLEGDVVRNEHSGDLLMIDAELRQHVYRVHHIGATELNRPLVDPREEMRAMMEIMPAPAPAPQARFEGTKFGSRADERARMISYEEYEANRVANGHRSRNFGWDPDFTLNATPRRNPKTTFAEWSRKLDANL